MIAGSLILAVIGIAGLNLRQCFLFGACCSPQLGGLNKDSRPGLEVKERRQRFDEDPVEQEESCRQSICYGCRFQHLFLSGQGRFFFWHKWEYSARMCKTIEMVLNMSHACQLQGL